MLLKSEQVGGFLTTHAKPNNTNTLTRLIPTIVYKNRIRSFTFLIHFQKFPRPFYNSSMNSCPNNS